MMVFFTNSSVMEFYVGHLYLFPFFSVTDGFAWFWMGSHRKNMLEVYALSPQRSSLSSRHLLVKSQQWKHQNSVYNLFKVNYKETNTTSHSVLVFPLLTLNR